jgi:succinyl-CoA synthetase alpha subunit
LSILVDKDTRVIIQGITGSQGQFHTKLMLEFGTGVAGGVTPGKGGQEFEGVPVFNTVADAVESTGAAASCIFVPPAFCGDAIMEAAAAGIKLIVVITEGIPTLDVINAKQFATAHGARIIGPNSPGIITPGECKIGILPAAAFERGPAGILSRSGTLTYEAAAQLNEQGIGQSTAFGLGGDPVVGTTFVDGLKLFADDPETEVIVLIGEIGGSAEEEAAQFITREKYGKPVVAFIAGRTAPKGKRMGHAGAIIAGGKGTAAEKIAALRDAGVHVAESPADIGATARRALGG